jgi:predicted RNase H-like HicB family nuclease
MAKAKAKSAAAKRTDKQYRVQFERDESGWWVASVPGVRGCHTQGRTLSEARRRIRQALGLFVDDAARATLIDDVKMPAAVRRVVSEYRSTRVQAERAQTAARLRAKRAVQLLAGGGMRLSRRDTADVLGVSFQRIQQLIKT